MGTRKRTILVTGGGSGIGKAIAQAFVREGSNVIILGRTEQTLRAAAAELGPSVNWFTLDVSDRAQVEAVVSRVVSEFKNIDVLINNAGFTLGLTTDMPLDSAEKIWDQVLSANLKGAFLMSLACSAAMVRPGGRIINISSIAAFSGGSRPGALAYAAAKAGINGLTFGLARELSPQGITVNSIAPGFIADTGFTGSWPEERVQWMKEQTPVGRVGHPDDVANATVYLASPQSSFITGQILSVNGGWMFR